MRLLRVCADPDCPELCAPGETYCPEHKAASDARRAERSRVADKEIKARSSWRWVYKDRRWTALRRQVLLEQPWCIVAECNELSREVDHIVALQDGGAPFRSVESGRYV